MSTDPALIENVLRAAGLPADEMSGRVATIGPETVAAILVAEVASRAALLNTAAHKFVVQFDLGFGEDRLGFLLTVGDGAPKKDGTPKPMPPFVRTCSTCCANSSAPPDRRAEPGKSR
jgi:demethylmacrocin O-methyltransferase